ncbi:hypothetical protein ACQ86N_48085 [Puia sp. P3]|uniref:hypothetical protein n=1 Tax=Puia sp. P3 TaxID=3423952 RepID=UPI003D66C1FA
MSQFLDKKELFDSILHLKDEEKQNPLGVIEQFFNDYRLHECRHTLWAMVETCLTTDNAEFSDPDERGNLIQRYRDLERLLEAGTLLVQRRQQK